MQDVGFGFTAHRDLPGEQTHYYYIAKYVTRTNLVILIKEHHRG